MGRFIGVSLVASLLMAGLGCVEASESNAVLVLSTPTVEKRVSAACFDFMRTNVMGMLRRDRTLLRAAGFGPEEQLKAFSAMRSERDALVVVLVNTPASSAPAVVYSVRLGCAVVNTAVIAAIDGLTDQGRLARIERAAMYGLGRLVGMPACLNPFCALSEYEHVQKDKIPGRNYCPNCCDRVAAGLRAVGVQERVNTRAKTAPSE
ncbi:MAG: hypothetical protein HN341_07065 [Verrucomicrobia bacterium]|jgi:predicted Zn-dependent protease|nr:hypothetical protein [Verrucomicrobiota bacterium]